MAGAGGCVAVALSGVLLAAQAAAAAGGSWFTDVTATAAVPSLKYGEGVNIVDLNADGLPEIFLPVPRGRCRLLVNRGGFAFDDGTAAKGLESAVGIGAVVWDLDGDGRPDVYVVRGEHVPGANGVYLQRADGTFVERGAQLGAPGRKNGISALALDADRDGAADLFVAGWSGNVLYRGDKRGGGGSFTEAADAGLGPAAKCWGAVSTDFDGDGWPDVVAACGARGLPQGARLYRNRGNGTFEDWTARSGVTGIDWAIGVVAADFHGQGRSDLLFTNLDGPDRLFRNDGGGRFTDVTAASGLASGRSVGATAGDVDGDLLTDLVVAGFAGPARVLRNLGGGRFADVTGVTGLGGQTRNDGIALADLDGDGDLDLYVTNFEGRNRLYRNELGGARALKVRVPAGAASVGAVARIYRAGSAGKPEALLATRELQTGYGVCSQGPAELVFHLPAGVACDLSVTWPDGTVATTPGVKPGTLTLAPAQR
ncbi:MAG TPA: VCBS repeat-containing protein [bacterium]